jgi:hypothetical protein
MPRCRNHRRHCGRFWYCFRLPAGAENGGTAIKGALHLGELRAKAKDASEKDEGEDSRCRPHKGLDSFCEDRLIGGKGLRCIEGEQDQ